MRKDKQVKRKKVEPNSAVSTRCTGYSLFCKEASSSSSKHPMDPLNKRWKALTQDERDQYREKAKRRNSRSFQELTPEEREQMIKKNLKYIEQQIAILGELGEFAFVVAIVDGKVIAYCTPAAKPVWEEIKESLTKSLLSTYQAKPTLTNAELTKVAQDHINTACDVDGEVATGSEGVVAAMPRVTRSSALSDRMGKLATAVKRKSPDENSSGSASSSSPDSDICKVRRRSTRSRRPQEKDLK